MKNKHQKSARFFLIGNFIQFLCLIPDCIEQVEMCLREAKRISRLSRLIFYIESDYEVNQFNKVRFWQDNSIQLIKVFSEKKKHCHKLLKIIFKAKNIKSIPLKKA